jgi:hypothetical protein
LTFEPCVGSGKIHAQAHLDSAPHLKQALAAVPYKIQKGFFEDLGGRIRITEANECSSDLSREDDALGCWRRLPDQKHSIEIVIRRSSTVKEQYALVRTFGFLYGDILLSRAVPNDSSAPVEITSRPAGSLASYKTHMVPVFLGELYSSVNEKSKNDLNKNLAALGVSPGMTAAKDFTTRWQEFSRLSPSLQDALASRIFAETFHSQFCSQKTAARACSKFPLTLQSFKPYVDDLLEEIDAKRLECPSAKAQTASATHLEWHSQNQRKISQREARGADKGAYVTSKISQAAQQQLGFSKPQSTSPTIQRQSTFSLNSDFIQQLMGLLTGGLSGDGGDAGGGLGGLLGQLFGGLGGGGGGGVDNLSGLLGSLGLSDLIDDGGDVPDDFGGNNLPDVNPQPDNISNNNNTPLPSGGIATAEEQAGIDATNRYRQSQGKSMLQIDQQMIADCRKQAQLQAQKGGLTHWLYPAGVARAENIAYGSKSGEYTVMQQWVKSPGHHANIMGNHRFIGIGSFGNQWCQRFR